MRPRFLFFLYYLPPATGTAPKRNLQISKALASHADKTIVYTAAYPDKPKLQIPGMEIYSNNVWDYRTLLRQTTKDGYLPEEQKRIWWKQWFIRGINSFPLNILIGEGGFRYYKSLLRFGEQSIQKENITHLYSSYRPFVDHYAAFKLKEKFPHLYWIADFRDLVVDPHTQHIFSPGAHHRLLKDIFSKADLLTTVSDGLALHLKQYNPNVITLRNGIEGEIQTPVPMVSNVFTIVYTGSMFQDQRNAEPLFLAIRDLIKESKLKKEEIKIIYAGKDGAYWNITGKKYGLDDVVLNKGIIPAAEAESLQQSACINLLLTASSDELQGVLTGKMIEYFKSGSPVLGIIVHQNDPELQSLLHELAIGDSFSDQQIDLPGIKAFILKEYLYWKETARNRKPVNEEVLRRKYSMEAVIEPLLQYLTPSFAPKSPKGDLRST